MSAASSGPSPAVMPTYNRIDVAFERGEGEEREEIAPDGADGLFERLCRRRRFYRALVARQVEMAEFECLEHC